MPKAKKKLAIVFFIAVVSVISSVAVLANLSILGDLACDDLSDCKTSASCGGPGRPNGCTIFCENGARIECPQKISN